MKRVQDEVAIITGAANGLGQAIAFRLAQDGANVILGDIDGSGLSTTASEIRKTGSQVITVVGDITEEAQAQELIDAALNGIQKFGKWKLRTGIIRCGSICGERFSVLRPLCVT